MNLKKIALFYPPHSNYGTMYQYTDSMFKAFEELGFTCLKIRGSELEQPITLKEKLFVENPQFTFSFNGLLPDSQGNFLADTLEIPHFAFLLDSPARFTPIFKSQYTYVICPDRDLSIFAQRYKFKRISFIPVGVDTEIAGEEVTNRDIDVLMLSTCIDYEEIREKWKQKYPKIVLRALEEAAEQTLSVDKINYVSAFWDCLERYQVHPVDVDYPYILMELENYIRGKDRIHLLKGLKDHRIELYGSELGSRGWGHYLKKSQNVKIHSPVPFSEAISLMRRAKVTLNSCPSYKNGLHTRFLASALAGSIPATNAIPYLDTHFDHSNEMILYRWNQYVETTKQIQYILEDEEIRSKMNSSIVSRILHNHTWKHRAEEISALYQRRFGLFRS